MHSLVRFASLLAAGLSLSGCILDRLWETHRQFYAKDPRVFIEDAPKAGMRFRFLEPTLLEKDVDWLIGQPPTRQSASGNERFAAYVLVQNGRRRADLPALKGRLRYVLRDHEYRLAEIELPRVANLLVTPEMISAAIETLRYPAPELFRRRLRVSLDGFRTLKLPSRREIEAAIGPPNQAEEGTAAYRFHLQAPGNQPRAEERSIDITLRYDAHERIQQAEGGYLRYRVRVDMEAAEAVLHVE